MLIKIGIRDFSPGMVAWLRIVFAAVVLVGLAASRGALRGLGGSWPMLFVLGATQVAGPFILIAAGETEISSSLAGILVTSAPLFTALLAIRFDQEERSQGARLFGIALGVAGVAVLLGVDLGGSSDALLGGLAILLAGFGYAVGGLIAKRNLGDLQPIGVAASVMLTGSVLLLPAAIIGFPGEAPGLGPIAAVIALGVVGTGVAFAIFYDLIATVGPARTFIVTYIAPALRGRLRRSAPRRDDHRGDDRRPRPDPGRLIPGRGGLGTSSRTEATGRRSRPSGGGGGRRRTARPRGRRRARRGSLGPVPDPAHGPIRTGRAGG